jgi:hypothetical protein
VTSLLLDLALAPLLVAVATLATRRLGERVGGLLSAFPAIVGPVLLITDRELGAAAARSAAEGTLLGLAAMSAFVAVYGCLAHRTGWRLSLAGGWLAAGAVGTLAAASPLRGLAWPLGAATGSVILALAVMPRTAPATAPPGLEIGLATRMLITVALVAALAGTSRLLGPTLGGMLAALPVLASVLAVFVHREGGSGAALSFLRGMMAGMFSFVGFCAVVAVLIVSAGPAVSFVAAATWALGAQLVGFTLPGPGSVLSARR